MSVWIDVKMRANDVQVGDYVWYRGSYEEARAVQYGVPQEGFVRVDLGEMGNTDAPTHPVFQRGDDTVVVAKRSGDKPKSTWHEIPASVMESLPYVVKVALEKAAADMREIRARGRGGRSSEQEAEAAHIAVVGLWYVTLSGNETWGSLLRQLMR